MNRNEHASFEFRLTMRPIYRAPAEHLWGRWIDQGAGLALAGNNAHFVPLAVNDTVRVARDGSGIWHVVEVVRLTESIVTYSSFEPPVTQKQALAVYDGWVSDGLAVHTEGFSGVMVTAWSEFTPLGEVRRSLGVMRHPGWLLQEVYTPEERRAALDSRVDFGVFGWRLT